MTNEELYKKLKETASPGSLAHELCRAIGTEQMLVACFMKACDQPVRILPIVIGISEEEKQLRKKLIEEEAKELMAAIDADDIVGIADGIADLMYVTLGAANTFGIPSQSVFNLVHENNMTKLDPATNKAIKNSVGKVIKPAHYKPVELEKLLRGFMHFFSVAIERIEASYTTLLDLVIQSRAPVK